MSSYYNAENNTWAAPGRQPSWEQQAPPSRSASASVVSREESNAFASQFEEIDRATDNLMKSGKFMAGGVPGLRRESMPVMGGRGGNFADIDPRMGGPSRHHSVAEFDGARPPSASNVQGFYASQRFQPRQNEAEQMLQAKRRMAAQRERELRNYHQEQQYNRNTSGVKSDRAMSPNTMSEDDRRELIARQHRALYGNDSTLYNPDGTPRQPQDVRVPTTAAGRGPSPLAFDPFGVQSQAGAESVVQMPPRDQASVVPVAERANSTSSPSSNPTTFSLVENAAQSSRTSTSSTGGSPPATTIAGVAPIGTRPAGAQPAQKRSTTPIRSPLSFGYTATEQAATGQERSTSAASNPPLTEKNIGLGGWGSNSGVWGAGKNPLGVQASVWG